MERNQCQKCGHRAFKDEKLYRRISAEDGPQQLCSGCIDSPPRNVVEFIASKLNVKRIEWSRAGEKRWLGIGELFPATKVAIIVFLTTGMAHVEVLKAVAQSETRVEGEPG